MRIKDAAAVALTSLVLGLCWSCAPSAGGPVQTIPVKGKVTFKGQPLTKGQVVFSPRDDGPTASAEIQPDGTFVLTTYQPNDGAIPGRHRVSIKNTGTNVKGGIRKTLEIVPVKYNLPNTSKLEAVVSAEQTEFPFDLN